MTTFSTKTNPKSTTRLYAALIVFFFSTMGMFAQTANAEEVKVVSETADDDKSEVASQMEFVTWFMAVKKSAIKSDDAPATISKKQFINCGMTPNRILSKSFLKKAINHDSTIA